MTNSQQFLRWQIIAAVDIVVEVLLVCLSIYLVHDLKMATSRKAAVVFAFLFRLVCVHIR